MIKSNLFPLTVIVMFLGASIMSFIKKDSAKGLFYIFSAAINVNILFFKG